MNEDPERKLHLFREAVRLLYGTRETARLLGIQDRAVLRLLNGSAVLHEGFIRDTVVLLLLQRDELERVAVDLFRFLDPLGELPHLTSRGTD